MATDSGRPLLRPKARGVGDVEAAGKAEAMIVIPRKSCDVDPAKTISAKNECLTNEIGSHQHRNSMGTRDLVCKRRIGTPGTVTEHSGSRRIPFKHQGHAAPARPTNLPETIMSDHKDHHETAAEHHEKAAHH